MEPGQRFTQHELAHKLGLSQASVSRALAGNARHSAALIERVRAEAQKFGYRPDPVLASLNAYRRTKRPITSGGSLLWFGAPKPKEKIYESLLYQAAHDRAFQLGYQLDYLRRFEPEMTARRLARICMARGIAGIILGPQPEPHTRLDIDIDNVAAVAFGRSIEWPPVDHISFDHFQAMELCYQKLAERGYRRIALVLSAHYSERVAGNWSGAFLNQQLRHPHLPAIAPLLFDEPLTTKQFMTWFRRTKPDIVITMAWSFGCLPHLKASGLRIPDDINIALLAVPKHEPELAFYGGVHEPAEALSKLAVDILVARIRNNEKGIPPERRIHLLPVDWSAGRTICR
jgi:DNA-binding LacI/PurR family transcriptional regulator